MGVVKHLACCAQSVRAVSHRPCVAPCRAPLPQAKNTHLKVLALGNCGLNDADGALLGEMLAVNTTLENLDLENNGIKDAGCTALAHGLAHNTALRSINVFGPSVNMPCP